jgi:hypothetical protein
LSPHCNDRVRGARAGWRSIRRPFLNRKGIAIASFPLDDQRCGGRPGHRARRRATVAMLRGDRGLPMPL